jgi:uncharacterized protein (DUF2225 family)
VCQKKIEVTKVKAKDCIVSSRDTDFCVYYEGVNPIFYDVWVCGNCGYAAQGEKFEEISDRDVKAIKEGITRHWKPRDFTGERDIEKALEAFKLALFNLTKMDAKTIDYAKVCLRIAWLYRMKEDKRETEFLRYAVRYYCETFESERFPVGKLDEYTCMYMIGELERRVGNYNDAVVWFNKVISSPEARRNKLLIENAREQYHLTKEQMENGG